jgi:hypothetical protein
MEIGFDVISDLHLSPDDSFNWENKATSLYCIVAGNVSSDLRTIVQTLSHLSKFYQGIFYTLGTLEYKCGKVKRLRTHEIIGALNGIKNVAILHHHVVIIDGVAVLGANGWEGTVEDIGELLVNDKDNNRYEDISYLSKSVEKLQRHLDVKSIVVVSNAVPKTDLYFGEIPSYIDEELNLDYCLQNDTETKITHWVFGSYSKHVDTSIEGINFVNNPYYHQRPYWAKRIAVNI